MAAAAEPAPPDDAPAVRDVDVYEDDGPLPIYGYLKVPGAAAVRKAVRGEGAVPETGLATRRQLRAMGLRPNGQEPAGQIAWRKGGRRMAWLYRIELAAPKRVPTLAQEAALDKAMARRQTCPKCLRRYHRCLPLKTLGSCLECYDGTPADPRDYTPATPEWLPAA